MPNLTLTLLKDAFAVCRLDKDDQVPVWSLAGEFLSVTRTIDELSVVCPAMNVPGGVTCERDWRCLKVEGPLDFSLIGILSALATPLAQAGISIFAVSTYDTDYLLVKDENLAKAIRVLNHEGHQIRTHFG